MANPWDGTAPPQPPDLSRLPLLERERINKPIPLRDFETYGMVCIFRTAGANYPNARVNVAAYRPEAPEPTTTPAGIQLDLNDYSGRIPTASVILTRENARTILLGMMRAYQACGGNIGEIISSLPAANATKEIDIRFSFEDDSRE